jgi:hypothetical protein
LQALPSEQLVPDDTGICWTPVDTLHESVVHGLPSSTTIGVPDEQVPLPLQTPDPLHGLPSEQLVPDAAGTCFTPFTASHESIVQALSSSITSGGPPHAPFGLHGSGQRIVKMSTALMGSVTFKSAPAFAVVKEAPSTEVTGRFAAPAI